MCQHIKLHSILHIVYWALTTYFHYQITYVQWKYKLQVAEKRRIIFLFLHMQGETLIMGWVQSTHHYSSSWNKLPIFLQLHFTHAPHSHSRVKYNYSTILRDVRASSTYMLLEQCSPTCVTLTTSRSIRNYLRLVQGLLRRRQLLDGSNTTALQPGPAKNSC